MGEEKKRPAYKFTLSTKKEVVLLEPKVSDIDNCMRLAGGAAGDNKAHLGILVQKELVKKTLVQINGERVPLDKKEDLDSLFTLAEYTQVLSAVQKVSSLQDEMDLKEPEIVMI